MTSEVIINVQPKDISIALLEDKELVEYQNEPREASYSVGNIYVAKVKKLMPGLNACFVDVGYEKVAFLHYLDLGLQFSSYEKYLKQVQSDRKKLYPIQKAARQPDLPKDGSVQNTLQVGQEVMVQVVKEPISTKGPRLTCELSFAGRYIVLIPFGDKVNVSSKIKRGEERSRLKQLIQMIKPKNFGVIVRTVAEGKKAAELDAEMKILYKRWEEAITKVQRTTTRPQLVYEEESRAVALLRDLFNPTYDGIHINDEQIYQQVSDYVGIIAPEKQEIVKLYKGTVPIFDNFNVTKQLKSGFGKTVNYKHGAYLIIEHTEAMHVVDVNSGTRVKKENGQEANALETNLGAADELARQLRLRDMGGIIVVDFVDMNLAEDRQMLYERMCKNMQKDRARHNILPLSKFGLMQITRQRVRPAMDVNVEEDCPTCFGSGKIKSSILFTDQLESKIDRLVNKIGIKRFYLHVHPYVAAYINQGMISLKRRWQMKYGLGVRIVPSQKLAFLQYEFYDDKRQFIDMKEEIETKTGGTTLKLSPFFLHIYIFFCYFASVTIETPYSPMATLKILFWILLFIVFYTYIGYGMLLYVLLFIKRLLGRKPQEPQLPAAEELPMMTLMICAYNEQDIIVEKMQNIRQIDYPQDKFCVMWVTDGSNDQSNELLSQYPEVKVVFSPERRGKAAAMQHGLRENEAPFVIFTDANTMLNANAIKEIARQFMKLGVSCVSGEKRVVARNEGQVAAEGEGMYWKYESTLKRWDSEFYSAMGAAGELFAVRMEHYREAPSNALLDDFMMSMLIVGDGHKIAYTSEAYAMEYGSANMHEESKRKRRIAAGGLQSIWWLRKLMNPFRYPTVSFLFISHRVLRWSLTP